MTPPSPAMGRVVLIGVVAVRRHGKLSGWLSRLARVWCMFVLPPLLGGVMNTPVYARVRGLGGSFTLCSYGRFWYSLFQHVFSRLIAGLLRSCLFPHVACFHRVSYPGCFVASARESFGLCIFPRAFLSGNSKILLRTHPLCMRAPARQRLVSVPDGREGVVLTCSCACIARTRMVVIARRSQFLVFVRDSVAKPQRGM